MKCYSLIIAMSVLIALSLPALATTFYGGDVGPTIDVDAASYSPPVATAPIQSSSYSGSVNIGSYSSSGGYSVSGSYLPSYYSYYYNTPYYYGSGYWPSFGGANAISPYVYYGYPYYYGYTGPFIYYSYSYRNAQNSLFASYSTSGPGYHAQITYQSDAAVAEPEVAQPEQTIEEAPQPLNTRAAWFRR